MGTGGGGQTNGTGHGAYNQMPTYTDTYFLKILTAEH